MSQAWTTAIAIGPEFGTVGPELIREAAKEAVKIADLLVVCGFAFDPLAGEEASTLGRLTIVAARMNPDLVMGDELLKKTGSGGRDRPGPPRSETVLQCVTWIRSDCVN